MFPEIVQENAMATDARMIFLFVHPWLSIFRNHTQYKPICHTQGIPFPDYFTNPGFHFIPCGATKITCLKAFRSSLSLLFINKHITLKFRYCVRP